MKSTIKYIELKSGYSDDGPAWIGKVEFSKSGKTMYFNGKSLKGNGHGECYELESGDTYWVSGVKKNGQDRHRAGRGSIMVDRKIADEYLNMVDFDVLDKNNFTLVDIVSTDTKEFEKLEHQLLDNTEPSAYALSFKEPHELNNEELKFIIEALLEDEYNARFNKGRRSVKKRRIEYEEELEKRLHQEN